MSLGFVAMKNSSCVSLLCRYLQLTPAIFYFPHLSLLCLKPGEDLDWDEEFALQDFLKRELVERNCKEGGNQDASPKEAADKLADRAEDGEEKWMVVEKAGEEEVRGTSTPLSAHPEEAQAGLGEGQGECGEALGGISALSIIILLGNIHVHPRNKSLTEYWDCPDSLQYRIMFVYGPTGKQKFKWELILLNLKASLFHNEPMATCTIDKAKPKMAKYS